MNPAKNASISPPKATVFRICSTPCKQSMIALADRIVSGVLDEAFLADSSCPQHLRILANTEAHARSEPCHCRDDPAKLGRRRRWEHVTELGRACWTGRFVQLQVRSSQRGGLVRGSDNRGQAAILATSGRSSRTARTERWDDTRSLG